MTLAYPTRRSSDLSKHSAEVFAEAELHPITVTRRDGESLVLMSHKEAEDREFLLALAAQLLSASFDQGTSLAERLTPIFPWMLALSPVEQELCAAELFDAARASFATEQAHHVTVEFNAWKETATAKAAGLDQPADDWLDNSPVVERP